MSDEWGPWIEHDGKGCPCVGSYAQMEYMDHGLDEGIAPFEDGSSWIWEKTHKKPFIVCQNNDADPVLRYRIKTPRGLTILRSILREVEHDKTSEYTAH